MPKKRFKLGMTAISVVSALGVVLAGCGSQSTSIQCSIFEHNGARSRSKVETSYWTHRKTLKI